RIGTGKSEPRAVGQVVFESNRAETRDFYSAGFHRCGSFYRKEIYPTRATHITQFPQRQGHVKLGITTCFQGEIVSFKKHESMYRRFGRVS
ncbi:hypothetical protein, partial [uncultured Gimesia sp.]|uniref:hypothetical protein n=1 Tax=uncultured Gimesia sp. TaxID=1678688 RepID=UPI0026257BA6